MSKNKFDEFFNDSHFKGDAYWYLRFSAKFFDDSVMYEMLNVPIYGKSFFIIFLKLCVKSLDKKGYIRIPKYFPEGNYIGYLSTDIKEEPKEVELAVNYFLERELISLFKSDKETLVYIPTVENNTGKSSKDADRKRLERKKRENFLKGEDEKPQLLESGESKKVYGKFENVYLREQDFEKFQSLYENYDVLLNDLSIDKKLKISSPKDDYKYLLKKFEEEGKKR